MIYPKPSKECGLCSKEENCPCECHNRDLINCRHYEVHIEEFNEPVKPVVDLDHFRN